MYKFTAKFKFKNLKFKMRTENKKEKKRENTKEKGKLAMGLNHLLGPLTSHLTRPTPLSQPCCTSPGANGWTLLVSTGVHALLNSLANGPIS